jgi:cobalt transporter subunit CbtA
MILALFRRLLLAAAAGGAIAGFAASGAQALRAIPLILEAERYETVGAPPAQGHTAPADGTASMSHNQAKPAFDRGGGTPESGLERGLYTVMANLVMGVGFGLLLAAAFALWGEVDWRRGLLFGLAGFASFSLAPALGLPPELPGSFAAPLAERQIWWLGTALATGAGLALILLTRRPWSAALGAALIALPHLIGAPRPDEEGGLAPARLAHEFVVAALATSFIFWLVLGAATGFFYKRFGDGRASA